MNIRGRFTFCSFLILVMVGNCDIHEKRKILVINGTKWDEISLKSKVRDQEKLWWISWTFVKVLDEVCPIFIHFLWHEQKLMKFSQDLTTLPSHFNNSYLKSFRFVQNLMRREISRFYNSLRYFTKQMKFHKIFLV